MHPDFLLRTDITFLNFGSFGATPIPIFSRYQSYQLELEQEPVQFLTVNSLNYLAQTRTALANYLNCQAEDIVPVMNPSYAVNIIAKNFPLKAGDEVLASNLEYGACDKTWQYYCDKAGAKYVRQNITLPIINKETFVEEFCKGITTKTKLIFLNHITSSTALIFPVKEIIDKAKNLGIPVFIDGAHAPAQIELNLQELDADFYTGACHKWMMAPKGTSFLFAKKEYHKMLDPLIISWGFNTQLPAASVLIDNHQLQGTRDISAFCTIPTVINYLNDNNWTEKAKICRQLVFDNAPRFSKLLKTPILAPLHTDFIGQMLSLKINCVELLTLKNLLYQKYKIEIPIMPHEQDVYIRFSIQVFNNQKDLDILFDALVDIQKLGLL
jgi:isopenicillin-N epimerase